MQPVKMKRVNRSRQTSIAAIAAVPAGPSV